MTDGCPNAVDCPNCGDSSWNPWTDNCDCGFSLDGRAVSEVLAEMTGRPKEDFEYDGELLDPEDLETIPAEEFYDE